MSTKPPTLWLIAGANGVGKTTYAFRHIRAVSGSNHFINLDEIARGLSPLEPQAAAEQAARVALETIKWRLGMPAPAKPNELELRRDFSLETTLSGRAHLGIIRRAQAAGYRVNLMYFAVQDVETCLTRIARRVSEGGHDVPEADVRRRFIRSLANFELYIKQVDLWRIFNAATLSNTIVAEGRKGCISFLKTTDHLPPPLPALLIHLPPCSEA